MDNRKKIYFIGCGILGPEIKHIARELSLHLKMKFLPGRLHNTPDLLRSTLQKAIDEVSTDSECERIIIGYGICGNGSVGIKSSGVPLVFPKVHDCIALFLGGDRAYKEQFTKYPGSYYITEGWQEEKEQNAADQEKTVWVGSRAMGCTELNERYGEKNGKAITDFFSSWTSNYQRAAYIDTGVGKRKKSFEAAQKMAADNKWAFEQLDGNLSLIKKLLLNTSSDKDILFVPAGHRTIYSATENGLASAPENEIINDQPPGSRHLQFKGPIPTTGAKLKLRFGLGLDAGGTYTDGVIYDFTRQKIVGKNKSFTTKWDFSKGIRNCLAGLDQDLLQKVGLVSVSTTLATNAIVEGDGQKTGLILMNGEISVSDFVISNTPKRCIKGRLSITGEEKELIDELEVRRVVRRMCDNDGVTAFAVSGFAGAINPAHEQMVRDIIKSESGMTVCCGHDLSDQLNYITRARTAVVNGRIIPKVDKLFNDLDKVLVQLNISAPVMVVKGDGTLMSRDMALEKPVETILSGPAASVAGARHITGLKNAIVVDIGGTTTDTGDIVNGEIAVSKEGATVGGVKTHVRALQMKTVGLGGDSHICYNDGAFTLGPRRVAPLVWADNVTEEGISEALDAMTKRPLHRQQQIIMVAMEGNFDFTPSEEEKKIYALLQNGPLLPEQLAEQLSILSPTLLEIGRLEESGLVQRCGLTPTDLLHIDGRFRRWSPEPANRAVEYLAQSLQSNAVQITHQLLELVTTTLAQELLNSTVFQKFSIKDLENSPLYRYLVDGFLSNKEMRYGMRPVLSHPIIGVGAPTTYFLPKAAEKLSAEVIIPQDADVANALGAITSHILVRRSLSIQPKDNGQYTVKGISGNPDFATLDEGEQWVISHLQDCLRQDAKREGTREERVYIDIDDSLTTLIDGSSLFLERTVTGYLKGEPDLMRFSNQ